MLSRDTAVRIYRVWSLIEYTTTMRAAGSATIESVSFHKAAPGLNIAPE